MTFEQKIKEYLVSNGMFENQAAAVFSDMKANDDVMTGRWQDDASEYPDVMLNVLLMSARHQALKFINENCPNAWFKPMFE